MQGWTADSFPFRTVLRNRVQICDAYTPGESNPCLLDENQVS